MIRHVFGVLVCSLALCSCSDGLTGPNVGPTIFQGTLIAGETNRHSLELSGYGGVRIELDDVMVRVDDTMAGESDDDLAIGFGLGQPKDGECITTFRTTMVKGDVLSFGLGTSVNCLLMFDSGALPGDVFVDYILVVTI